MTVDPSDIKRICRDNGLRLTAPRKIIVETLLEATDHPDAVELHRRVTTISPRIALSTVYRTLVALSEKGVLEKHNFGNGPARFETVDREHHDHLIDVVSGNVIEFRSGEIERLQEEIARQHGFEIVSHKLEIYVRPAKRREGKTSATRHRRQSPK